MANRKVNGKQHTIRFHVDDVLSSHVDPRVNDEFEKWLNKMYGTHGPVTSTRGREHDYLGMKLIFHEGGELEVDMKRYVKEMLEEFPVALKKGKTAMTPATSDLFSAGKGKVLNDDQQEVFHRFVAKGLFMSKRRRPDVHQVISVLCTIGAS